MLHALAGTLSTSRVSNMAAWNNSSDVIELVVGREIAPPNRTELPFYFWPYDEPLAVDVFWGLVFAGMTAAIILGNLLVLYTVLGHRQMRTKVNAFIVNMAVSDIFSAFVCINPDYWTSVVGYWPFGLFGCKAVRFLQCVAVSAGIFTMCALCLDRYVAIVYPFRAPCKLSTTIALIVFVWVLACALASPLWLVSDLSPHYTTQMGGVWQECIEKWSNDSDGTVYSVVLTVCHYWLPVALIVFGYSRISRALKVNTSLFSPAQLESRQIIEKTKYQKKMVKMFSVVVAAFAVSWFPLNIINVLYFTHDLHVKLMSYSHSAINPLIYYKMSNHFKYRYRKVAALFRPECGVAKPMPVAAGGGKAPGRRTSSATPNTKPNLISSV